MLQLNIVTFIVRVSGLNVGTRRYDNLGKRVPIKVSECIDVDICCVIQNWGWILRQARQEDIRARETNDPLVQASGVLAMPDEYWNVTQIPEFDPRIAYFSCRDT